MSELNIELSRVSTVGAKISGASYLGKGDPGEPGVGILSVTLNADYTLTINLDDGTSYTTPPIRGERGERGEQGVPGTDGHAPVITAEKVGKITTIYVDETAVATIQDGEDGAGSVISVNGQTGNVTIDVPERTSQLENDSGFLTEHQSLDGYATEEYVDNHHDSTKQSTITDLDTIRSGAASGATAVQPEAGKGLFSGAYGDLTGKPTIPSAVTEDTVSGWGFTKNAGTYVKPSGGIPAGDIASNAVSTLYTASIATGWSGTAAPYSKAVTINGILATDQPIIDLNPSTTYATAEPQIEQWGYVYRAVTAANKITFYATEKPTVALPIKVRCIRK